jgi:hypothetical protein
VVQVEHHPSQPNNPAHDNRLIEVVQMQELELSNVNHDNVHLADGIQNWNLERGRKFGNSGTLTIRLLEVESRWLTI